MGWRRYGHVRGTLERCASNADNRNQFRKQPRTESFAANSKPMGLKRKHLGPPCILRCENEDRNEKPRLSMRAVQHLALSCLLPPESQSILKAVHDIKLHNRNAVEAWVLINLPSVQPKNLPCLQELFVADALTSTSLKSNGSPAINEIGRVILAKEKTSNRPRKEHIGRSSVDSSTALKCSLESLKAAEEVLEVLRFPKSGVKLDKFEGNYEGFALDCEMCMSGSTSVLTRMAVVRFSDATVLIDQLVRPSLHISDFVTQFSGITEDMLQDVTFTLQDAQEWLRAHIGSTDFLIGHSIENDLKALGVQHSNIIDTALLFRHYRGLPFRSSLKYLTQKYLGWKIQQKSQKGHNPVEDAIACERLVKAVLQHGPEFADERLERTALTKFLSDMNYSSVLIGPTVPQWDGMGTGDHIINSDPAGSVEATLKARKAHQFVCCTLQSDNHDVLNAQVHSLVTRLPPRTLVIALVGSGDHLHDEVQRLNSRRATYRREYKGEKRDEIAEPWTIEDDNALKRANFDLRSGHAFFLISVAEDEINDLPSKVRAQVRPTLHETSVNFKDDNASLSSET